jgi:hypothetical protein
MIAEIKKLNNKEVFYFYDGDGQFNTKIISHGEVGANNVFMQQMWDNFHERLLIAREEVISGKRSPLCYHMERTRMDVLTLAVYIGYMPGKVKRHFRPGVYKKLSPEVKARYAEIFDIDITELDNINFE